MAPAQLVHQAKEAVDYFLQANQSSDLLVGVMEPLIQRWIKPPIGMLKLNCDTALDRRTRKMGVGAVVRDSSGEVWRHYPRQSHS